MHLPIMSQIELFLNVYVYVVNPSLFKVWILLGGHTARCAKHHANEQRAAGGCVEGIFCVC